jgi:hypothetical protein
MKTIDQRLDRLKGIYSASADRMKSKLVGKSVDPDVQLYEKMTPAAFDAVREKYGVEGLTRYIRHIEHKRLMEAGGK